MRGTRDVSGQSSLTLAAQAADSVYLKFYQQCCGKWSDHRCFTQLMGSTKAISDEIKIGKNRVSSPLNNSNQVCVVT